jgi:hypothetical protein
VVIEERIQAREAFAFGELSIAFEGDGAVIAVPALAPGRAPNAPGQGSVLPSLRQVVREWTRVDDAGRYRPLPGAKTMRTGWQARCEPGEVMALLDEVYPLAERHTEQYGRGALRVVAMDEVLERQTGRYKVAAELDARGREVAQQVLCGRCVKAPVWGGEQPASGQIPCPEPCSVMVSLCREAALWQQAMPPGAPVDSEVAFAAFDAPGNEVRETYLEARRGLARS